ncbi:hypothetical protein MSAN_02287700 [Mycena sanguinolenta]|uniref:F-box domain-containing protein n=1 Tax=Mycena sanguinolenta TaxID=230812 RepID=A0A8H6X8H8_9AGAR|nr:hypothetical protein MSAN_02287700 [Mycena sanguinolenta]
MSALRISAELWRNILLYCPYATTVSFTFICQQFRTVSERIRYRKVRLSYRQALLFFRTLHDRPSLGAHVRSLYLHRPDSSVRHEGSAFEAALTSMTGLWGLQIMCPVDVQALLGYCHAPLRSFTYGLPSCDALREFLAQQPFITSIRLYHPLNRDPTPWFLPMLEKVEALTVDLADLIVGAPVRRISFRYRPEERVTQPVKPPIFFTLSAVPVVHVECMACQLVHYNELDRFLPSLETLVVLQDVTWGDRTESVGRISSIS